MEIQGSAALVTGAASGLGAATARRLADAGATVFGLDLEQSIERAGDSAPDGVTLIPTDVTSDEGVQSAIDRIVESGVPLRIVVNCAGVGWAGRILSKNGPHDLELFRTVITVNLLGTFNVMRLAADAIAKTEPVDESGQRGVVINTASVAAFEGQIGQIAYSASKGGVHGMTVPAARDLAQFGIRVNTIAPGIVDTPMLAGVTEEYRKGLEAGVPFPSRLGTARRVRTARADDRRARLPQRRDHPHGRRAAHGAALIRDAQCFPTSARWSHVLRAHRVAACERPVRAAACGPPRAVRDRRCAESRGPHDRTSTPAGSWSRSRRPRCTRAAAHAESRSGSPS